jgi:hypothetical protein
MSEVADLARRLAENAHTVCRNYLSRGHRQGRYWLVGDVRNTPGRSLYVRLRGAEHGPGAAGRWTDSATGEYGDLLDLIRLNRGFGNLRDTLEEARRFLSLPCPQLVDDAPSFRSRAPQGSPESARRLFAMSKPIASTLAETYLRARRITHLRDLSRLRFHPNCYCKPDDGPRQIWPALIAAVTDLSGTITGAHRTWLDPSGSGKAPLEEPRKSLGHLLGNAVRFGVAAEVLAAGEGIETMLSLREALPGLPMAAGLSANHLAAILFPPGLRVLYIARDADPAGDRAVATLTARSNAAGIEARVLAPRLDDFNDDLRRFGVRALRERLGDQLALEHVARFVPAVADME